MAKTFKLIIINPEKIIYEGEVVSLVAPSSLGYLGVLADHSPLIAKLSAGKIITREESGKTAIFDSKGFGFLEVLHNNVTMVLH